ncbi:MAG TPA: hypothetical protein VFZ86_01035 [Thermoleophilia bacterium]|nr:hypothetical protein [Thermoleophilia bacterium]
MPRLFATFVCSSLLIIVMLASPAGASPPFAQETPIAAGPGAQQSPDLGPSLWNWPLTWETDASGVWHAGWRDSTQTETVSTAGGAQRHPAVFQDRLVYEDDRNGTVDLYRTWLALAGYPTPTEQDVPFAAGPGDQLDPAVGTDSVAYESNAAGNWDICVRSISSGLERRLTTNVADQVDPAIEGSIVVWADHRNGNWDIYCRDLDSDRTSRLTTSAADQTAPQIGNGRVVYQDDRSGNWDIYAYTLASGKERRLTTDGHDQTAPQIGLGRTVVYQDDRAGAADIFLCDLVTGANRAVTDDPAAQTEPCVAGAFVAWTDSRSGDPDIYGCTLAYPTLTLQAPWGAPRYGSTVTFSGSLAFGAAAPAAAGISVRARAVTRTVAVSGLAGGSGDYGFSLRNVVRREVVTARYAGGTAQLPSAPVSVTVVPTALLSRPVPRRIAPTSTRIWLPSLDVSGTLRPKHRADSRAVRLEIWWSNLGLGWERLKTVTVRVRSVGGASVYSLKILPRMNPTARYKIRAVHADSDHARTYSPFSKVVAGS